MPVFAAGATLGGGLLVDALLGERETADEFVVIGTAVLISVALGSSVVTPPTAEAGAAIGDGLLIAFRLLVGTGADPTALASAAYFPASN